MSAWKSPLLYIGIALILIAAAAAAVPPFIDWNSYRADLEAYGKQLTGRDVRIAGDVRARLFPWPALWLDDVRVANQPGAKFPELMRTGKVSVGLSLAPLMSGKFVVESIQVDEPVFAFERLPSGIGTWSLNPTLDLGQALDVSRISVAGIDITNGTVILADGRRGGAAKLTDVDALLSAPGLDGPWRLRGAVSYAGQRQSVGIATGKVRPGAPLRFSVNLRPDVGTGQSYLFDGVMAEGADITGQLKVRPARSREGKGDAELDLRPLSLRADVKANFDRVELDKIEIAPDGAADAGNLLTGAAQIRLGSQIGLDTQLKAAKLDLDGMMGARARQSFYNGEAFSLLSSLLFSLPDGFTSRFSLAVTSLVLGGESVDGFSISGEAAQDKLKINRIEASMPGQTTGVISGLFVPDDRTPQFSGNLDVESVSLRDFVVWALPEQASDITKVWSGARGKLDFAGKVDISPDAFRLAASKYVLDDAEGNGSLVITGGDQPGLAIRVVANSINLDRYAPNGLTVGAVDSGGTAGVIDIVGAAMSQGDMQLTVQADELVLHGVTAIDIAIDAGADQDGVEFRTVEMGSVGGARVDIAGLLKFPETGVSGAVKADIKAADARGLLRLLGIIARDPRDEPAWASALGAVDVNLKTEARNDNSISLATTTLKGVLGPAQMDMTGRFSGNLSDWENATVNIEGTAAGNSVAALAALAGVELSGSSRSGFSARLKAEGTPGKGMNSSLTIDALGTGVQFAGRSGLTTKDGVFAEGRLAVLAERARELFTALGMHPAGQGATARVLSAEGALVLADGQVTYSGVSGTASGSAFNGEMQFVPRPDGIPEIRIKANTGRLDSGWLLGAALFARDGQPVNDQTSFDVEPELPATIDARFEVKRLEVLPGIALANSVVSFRDDGKQVSFAANGDMRPGEKADVSLTLTRKSFDVAAEGRLTANLQLEEFLRTDGERRALAGPMKMELSVAGAGRSPAGILSALKGTGSYELGAGALGGVNVKAFADGLLKMEDAKAFDNIVRTRLGAGDLIIPGGKGKVNIEAGVMKFVDMPIEANGVSGKLRTLVDMPSGEVDISALLEMDAVEGIPPFEVAYSGPPRALRVSRDVAAVKSYVGVNVLLKGMDRLEELQREQERIFRQESSFDREQVLQKLEEAARKRREAAEQARREAEAERLRQEREARLKAEAEAKRLAAELEEQRQRAEDQRRLDEITREIAEEEAKRVLEEAASRTRLEKHIRRAVPSTNTTSVEPQTIEPAPLPQEKPEAPPPTSTESLESLPVSGETSPGVVGDGGQIPHQPTPIVPRTTSEPTRFQSRTDQR